MVLRIDDVDLLIDVDGVFFFNKQKANKRVDKRNHHTCLCISKEKLTAVARTYLTELWGLTNQLSGTIRRFEMECLSLSRGIVLVFVRMCRDSGSQGQKYSNQQDYNNFEIYWICFCTRFVKRAGVTHWNIEDTCRWDFHVLSGVSGTVLSAVVAKAQQASSAPQPQGPNFDHLHPPRSQPPRDAPYKLTWDLRFTQFWFLFYLLGCRILVDHVSFLVRLLSPQTDDDLCAQIQDWI